MEDPEEPPTTEVSNSSVKPPLTMEYCPVCTLPPEYCEFGPSFERCKPWLRDHHPELYPEVFKAGSATTKTQDNNNNAEGSESTGAEAPQEGEKESKGTGKRGGKGLVKPEKDTDVQILPGGKVKKKEKPIVHISRVQRNKRKYVTVVSGLEKFGIKLPEAAKIFAKRFSCGASVVKSPGGTEDEIDVQGDIVDELTELIEEKWEIGEDSITVDEGKRK